MVSRRPEMELASSRTPARAGFLYRRVSESFEVSACIHRQRWASMDRVIGSQTRDSLTKVEREKHEPMLRSINIVPLLSALLLLSGSGRARAEEKAVLGFGFAVRFSGAGVGRLVRVS